MNERPRIVLFQPDIPGNTGTILRLAANLGMAVDIIEPAGFRLDDTALRRSGMDYLDRAALQRHVDWNAFEEWRAGEKRRLILLSTKASKSYTDFNFCSNDCIIFGRESSGATEAVHEAADTELIIPMQESGRSLNIALSVAMVSGEALRQLG
ncbi:MAG: tRNA (cytidine(34)-2'-O)-methyltransferase [Rhizobiaceae bacterium]